MYAHYVVLYSSNFDTVTSCGHHCASWRQRCDVVHCFAAERTKGDKDTKRIKQLEKNMKDEDYGLLDLNGHFDRFILQVPTRDLTTISELT